MQYDVDAFRGSPRIGRRAFVRTGLAFGGFAAMGGTGLLLGCGDDDDTSDTTAGSAPGTASASDPGTAAPESLTKINTVFSWVSNVEWAGWWVADDQGYFVDEGIEFDFVSGGPNAPENVQVIEAGQAQLGTASDTLKIVDAAIEGANFVMIAAVLQESPLGMIWLDPELSKVEDFIGKRIGADSNAVRLIDAMFDVNGLAKDYEFVTIGFDPAPLANGEIDAMVGFLTNQPIALELEGHEPKTATFASFGFPLYADAIFGKRDYLDQNRAEVVSYLRALIKGWEHNMREPNLGAELAVNKYGVDLGLDLEQAKLENAAQIELQRSAVTEEKGILWMDMETITGPMYEGITATGRKDLPDPAKLFDLSFLEEAYGDSTSLLGS